jgi:hypothetical protein
MPEAIWRVGDRVYHAGKPEWGTGEVRAAEQGLIDGKRGQRLTVRFDRAGVKTIATQYADVRAAGDAPRAEASDEPVEAALDTAELRERLVSLPEEATDPFKTRRARLQATLGLYRFTGQGGSLLDWAAVVSGLKDPLSRFNRHELEQFFQRFRGALDAHLKRLLFELKKDDPNAARELGPSSPPAAQQMLKRLDSGR